VSSNDELKARGKAYRKAGEQVECRRLLESPEDYGWDIVWLRAMRYADRVHREQLDVIQGHLTEAQGRVVKIAVDFGRVEKNLADVTETAKLRLEKINSLQGVVEDLERTIGELKGRLDRQQEVTRVGVLSNTKLRAELEETKKHTTSATWKVFEDNDRLVAKVRELEALNESLRTFNDDCMKKRDGQLTILAEEKALTRELRREVQQLRDEREALLRRDVERLERIAAPGCQVTKGHAHTCTGGHAIGRGHPHACSCGHRWYA
jgi:peptidoglycan hydrolase CwlO-like protein